MKAVVRLAGWALCALAGSVNAQYTVTDVGGQTAISAAVSSSNASGQSVSAVFTTVPWGSGFAYQAVLTQPGGTTQNLGAPVPFISQQPGTLFINDAGQVAGTTAFNGSGTLGPRGFFVTADGTWQTLSNGSEDVRVQGMNQTGMLWGITGQAGDQYYQGFVTGANGVGMSFFGNASVCSTDYCGIFSTVTDVNVLGQVIGMVAGQSFITGPGATGLTALSALATLPSGTRFTRALDIDDLGRVLAAGSDGHNYLLTPGVVSVSAVPEPSALFLMALGLVSVGVSAWARRRRTA